MVEAYNAGIARKWPPLYVETVRELQQKNDALVAALREIEANNADPLDVEIARAALAQVGE
jgi:hypothetical protein